MIGRSRTGRPSLRRLGSGALFVGAASAALALAGPDALVPFRDVAGAAAEVSVAFVVDFGGSGAPVVACVNVPSGDNGYQALAALVQQENLAAPTYAVSGLLCSINEVPTSGCGQKNPDGSYAYWSYWRLGAGGSWSYGTGRPPNPVPQSGDVEGWRFEAHGSANPNDPSPGAAPEYAAICPDALTSTPTTAAPVTPTTVAATQQPAVVASPGSPASPTSGRPAAAVGGSASIPVAGAHPSTATSVPRSTAGTTATLPGGSEAATTPTTPTTPSSHGNTEALGAVNATAHHPGGNGALPLVIGGSVIAVLVAGAMLRWRKRPRMP